MSTPGLGSLVGIARTLVAHAEAQGATQAEALVLGGESALTRFANSEIHQNVAETDLTANLRFVIGRRIGVASSNRLDEAGLRELAERAGHIARVQQELEDFVSLPGPGPVPAVSDGYSEATASCSPEARAAAAGAVIAAADRAGVLAYGSLSTSTDRVAVANSLGIAVEQATTIAQLITVCMGPDGGAGYGEAVAVDVTGIDAEATGEEAAGRARRSYEPIAVPPGEYAVVLEPYAVVDLLDMLGYLGFSAAAVQEGRSFFEAGKRIGSELVSIWDDGADPAGTPTAFDYEGVAKQRVDLVDQGICREVVYDAQTASREGRTSTGHGLPAPNPWGPFPQNGFMAPGDSSHEQLIAGLDRGLLVTRFHYTNPVHPKLGIVTGMTRDGTFLVEHGEIVGPVRNLRYTQSYLTALAGVRAVGAERRLLRGFLGSVLVPALRIEAFEFTGATEH